MRRLNIFVSFLAPLLYAQPQPAPQQFFPVGPPEASASPGIRRLARDTTGNLYAASTLAGDVLVTKLDRDGHVVWRKSFGGTDLDVPVALALGPDGSVFVAGPTKSVDFPLVNPYLSQGNIFLTKIDPEGTRLVYSTLLGPGIANALAVDPAGNAYVAGVGQSPDFQSTEGAFQTVSKGPDAFVVKLDASGSRAIYATFLGGNGPACRFLGTGCGRNPFGFLDADTANAIVVDGAGNAYVGGMTSAADFPTTPDSWISKYPDPGGLEIMGFIAKLSPDGRSLAYSTYVGPTTQVGSITTIVTALALDEQGRLWFGGLSQSAQLVPAGQALQRTPPVADINFHGFVGQLDAAGAATPYLTYFAGTSATDVEEIAVEPGGVVSVSGFSLKGGQPSSSVAFGRAGEYVGRFRTTAPDLLFATALPAGSSGAGLAADGTGNVLVLGQGNVITPVGFLDGGGRPLVYGVTNAATPVLSAQVGPGELVAIYGVKVGPEHPAGLTLDASGRVSRVIGNTQVLFDGLAAPLLYAQSDQINAVVPYEVAGRSTTKMQVITAVGPSPEYALEVIAADPQIFQVSPLLAAALNEDGSINSPNQPATYGSIVSIFGTGYGLDDPVQATGSVTAAPLPRPRLPITVLASRFPEDPPIPAEVLYAGAAPALVAGVLQVNFRLPPDPGPVQDRAPVFMLKIGDRVSAPARVFVR